MADDKKIIFSMVGVSKSFQNNKQVLKDIYLSFFYGAKIGIIGLNGSGKSTLMKIIAGIEKNYQGEVVFSPGYSVGYLAQEPQLDDTKTVKEVVMEGVQQVVDTLAEYEEINQKFGLPEYYEDPEKMDALFARQAELQDIIDATDAWNLDSKLERAMDALRCPPEDQLVKNLSGGERRRVALCRLLLQKPDILLLDEPTNHLDADSIEWLRGYLKKYEGGFLVISHSTELLDEVVNKVWHLDAQLGQIDMYSLGWKAYLHQRVVDEERRRREREVAEKKADRLMKQGIRLHAKATKAVAAQNMMRRAEKLLENTSEAQKAEKVADIRFPEPAPCGRTPIMAKDISKAYGSNIVFAGVNLAIDKGSRVVILGYNGAGKTTTLRLLAHIEEPDTGSVEYGHGCKIGYFAQEHDTLDLNATVLENLQHVAPELDNTQARSILGSFLFSGDDAMKPAHVLSGGEKTRLALATLVTSRANVLLLDEPTNNLDPASREEILKAIAKYEGAIVLVTHDEGAVEALNPERVLLMPDGDEDLWNDSYLELVAEE